MNILDLLSKEERMKATRISFRKREILFQEGDLCKGVYVIEKGSIKIASFTLEGHEVVYNALGEGKMFGNNLAFSDEPYFRGSVIGDTGGMLSFFEKKSLLSLLQSNEAFLQEYLRIQSEFGKSLNAKIKLLSFASAEERFDFFLTLHKGVVSYSSVSALADSLFLKRETLSRLIHTLERKGKILIENKSIKAVY